MRNGFSFQMLYGEYRLVETKNPTNVGLDDAYSLSGQQDSTMLPIIYSYNKVIIGEGVVLKNRSNGDFMRRQERAELMQSYLE